MSDNNQESPSISGFDGVEWAKLFIKLHGGHVCGENERIDEALMTSWFCNAIMAGYDEAMRRNQESPPVAQDERLEELVRNEMLSRYGFDPMVKSQMVQASNDQFRQATGFLECVDWMLRNGMVRLPLLSERTKR